MYELISMSVAIERRRNKSAPDVSDEERAAGLDFLAEITKDDPLVRIH
jgi:hypothetical protein